MPRPADLQLLLNDLITRIEPLNRRQTIGLMRCLSHQAAHLMSADEDDAGTAEWAITATFVLASLAVLTEHLASKSFHNHKACNEVLPFMQDALNTALALLHDEQED